MNQKLLLSGVVCGCAMIAALTYQRQAPCSASNDFTAAVAQGLKPGAGVAAAPAGAAQLGNPAQRGIPGGEGPARLASGGMTHGAPGHAAPRGFGGGHGTGSTVTAGGGLGDGGFAMANGSTSLGGGGFLSTGSGTGSIGSSKIGSGSITFSVPGGGGTGFTASGSAAPAGSGSSTGTGGGSGGTGSATGSTGGGSQHGGSTSQLVPAPFSGNQGATGGSGSTGSGTGSTAKHQTPHPHSPDNEHRHHAPAGGNHDTDHHAANHPGTGHPATRQHGTAGSGTAHTGGEQFGRHHEGKDGLVDDRGGHDWHEHVGMGEHGKGYHNEDGFDGGTQHGAGHATEVPEPGIVALFTLAIGGVMLRRRRRPLAQALATA